MSAGIIAAVGVGLGMWAGAIAAIYSFGWPAALIVVALIAWAAGGEWIATVRDVNRSNQVRQKS